MDDPEELAAAFFAEQAAKEKARITLPVDDWTRAIIAVVREKGKKANNDDEWLSRSCRDSDCEFWAGTRQTPQAEKYSLLYLSIRSVEVALICRSNNKLSFDALYLYMVKTYDPAVANLFPI
jgi:hypothetical protein